MEDEKIGGSEALALCIKNTESRVLKQSMSCKALCGDESGKVCEKGCMALLKRRSDQSIPLGMQSFPAQTIGNQTVDIVVINDGNALITIMMSLENDLEIQSERIASCGLTKRESEISALVLRGKTNREIARTLHIALSTVKKHLYSIYQKIPDHEITKRRSKDSLNRNSEES
jgi:ATP/maltotriose-dependent transcriptional regulator MalT